MSTALTRPSERATWIDCTPEEYHRASGPPRLSQSLAHKMISKSPMHAKRALDFGDDGTDQDKPSKAKKIGTVVHALLLGKGAGRVILADPEGVPFKDRRTNAAKAAEAAAKARGFVPMLQHEAEPMLRLADRIRSRLWDDFGIELNGKSEAAIHWTERATEGTPVLCRGMLDHWKPPFIFDLKITKNAHPDACRRFIVEHGCDIQRAAYLRAVEQVHPDLAGRVRFVFLFCEVGTGVPTPVELRGEMAQIGALKWRRAVDMWSRCLAADRWPAYTRKPIVFSEAKPWERDDEMHAQGENNEASFARPPAPDDDDDEPDSFDEGDDE